MTADTPTDEPAQADQPCPPCRGTGQVIAMEGEEPKTVECPWCEGSGRWLADHDAQARFQKQSQSQSQD